MYIYTVDQLKEFSIEIPIFSDGYFEKTISINPFIRIGIEQCNDKDEWRLNGYNFFNEESVLPLKLRGYLPTNITALYSYGDLISGNFIDIHLSNFKEEVENTFNRLKKLTVFK